MKSFLWFAGGVNFLLGNLLVGAAMMCVATGLMLADTLVGGEDEEE